NYQNNNLTQMTETTPQQPNIFGMTNNNQNNILQNMTNSTTSKLSNNNIPIPQVKYENLPEFEPLNVKLENVPIYSPNPVFYSTSNYNNNSSNGFGIDIGQLLEAGEALFDLWQSNNKRKQNQSNKNQQNQQNQQQKQNIPVEQNYEFIPE
ncbi:hypothetical protein IJS77_03405, partial [bacterium]|nr:hypothetical protein [bacterium]